MTGNVADSATHRLATIPPGGPVMGHSVALPARSADTDVCLMAINAGDGVIHTAVRAISLPEVPPGTVVIGEDLAAEWDVDLNTTRWALAPAAAVPLRRLTLELPTERDPAAVGREIAGAGLLGELLWVPDGSQDMWLAVNGLPHRVREADVGGRTAVVARITPDTTVELYASAVRAGVDMVILADCSGSMAIDDLPAAEERPRLSGHSGGWISRMTALQESLTDLLHIRLQTSGRISRLALVEFNHQTHQRFPRDGGMAQLDATSPTAQIDEFRQGLALLRPSGTTNIGNALHQAADLLYQHGHVGNEKLIVLVSDGADWTPKGEKGTGEVLFAAQEPVSLMTHLHRDLGIRLHAIGIGTKELFHRRGSYEPTAAVVPNHDLLEELVKVGGGDPTTIGGREALENYFSGLGAGMIHRVRDRLTGPAKAGPLPAEARAALLRLGEQASRAMDGLRAPLVNRVVELAGQCRNEAMRALGGPIWDMAKVTALCQRDMGRVLSTDADLARFLAQAARTLQPNSLADDVPQVTGSLRQALDRLEGRSRLASPAAARSSAEFDGPAGTLAATQIEVIQLIHDTLADLLGALRRLPAQRPAPPEQGNQQMNVSSGFVYRD